MNSIESTVSMATAAAASEKAAEGTNDTVKENVVKHSTRAAAEVAVGATAAAAAKTNDDNDALTISRFLVQNIRGGRGYTTADYQIDLINERHGLYDLVSSVYDILQSEKLTNDRITSHLWDVTFAGKNYRNGWRRYNPIDEVWDRPAGTNEVDEEERRILSSLVTPLAVGQKGVCSGESATFDIIVKDVCIKTVKEKDVVVKMSNPWECFDRDFDNKHKKEKEEGKSIDNKKAPQYPQITKVNIPISGVLNDDWITPTQKTQCATLRTQWKTYYSGLNSWKRDRRRGGWVPAKPQSPPWNNSEIQIMGYLLNSDCKFKKSWNNILQYAFVNRQESAASMKWYDLKKHSYMIEYHGRNMTNDACIKLAKRLAKQTMTSIICDGGAPRKDPHPDARLESKLRKRGKIDDDTDPEERKRLCALFRGVFSDDSDGDY